MARERKHVLVRMPAELKRRLTEEVVARGSNLNDVAVEILASRFAVPFEASGRRSIPRSRPETSCFASPPRSRRS